MEAEKVLEEIARQVRVCTRCMLHHSRKNGVPGEGPAHAEIMLIGEGPGFYENEQGRPFVGAVSGVPTYLLLMWSSADRQEIEIHCRKNLPHVVIFWSVKLK